MAQKNQSDLKSLGPDRDRDIQVLALDMDDTLLRSDGALSPRTLEALTCWRATGGHVVIATGRPPRNIAPSLPAALHDVHFIAYNGADVRLGDEVIHVDCIPTADGRSVLAAAQTALVNYAIGLEIDDQIYLNRAPDRPKQFTQVADLLEVAVKPAAKILFFPTASDADFSLDDAALNQLFENLPASVRMMRSDRYRLVQLMSTTADKVAALEIVLAQWGLALANVMAFGDDVNDVEMVRRAGVGVAVANAIPEVHAVADRVTLSNDDDGVAVVIEELLRLRNDETY